MLKLPKPWAHELGVVQFIRCGIRRYLCEACCDGCVDGLEDILGGSLKWKAQSLKLRFAK